MEEAKTIELFGLTPEQRQKLGNYLGARPYSEVDQLVEILKQLPLIKVTVPPPPAPVELPVSGEDSAPESVVV